MGENGLGRKRDGVVKVRGAAGMLQGCEREGLAGGGVFETEIKRLVLFGGERVASYSKKF